MLDNNHYHYFLFFSSQVEPGDLCIVDGILPLSCFSSPLSIFNFKTMSKLPRLTLNLVVQLPIHILKETKA